MRLEVNRLRLESAAVVQEIEVKICKAQELKQSEPKSGPQNQIGKYLILQIVKIYTKREHMVSRVSSYFPQGGHSATETEVNVIAAQVRRNVFETLTP